MQPDEVAPLFDEVARCEHIRVEGLMAMTSLHAGPDKIRREFRNMRALFDTFPARIAANISMQQLSMG